jgi:tyrosyl-DNA phosphodiesterase 2
MDADLVELRRSKARDWQSKTQKSQPSRSRSPRRSPMDVDAGFQESLRVLTWNVDGLNENAEVDDLLGRTLWVTEEIIRIRPHVIFLQELVDFSFSIIEQRCRNSFHVFRQSNCDQPYYVAILVHKATMEVEGVPMPVRFPKSLMGREGLYVAAKMKDDARSPLIGFLTAHLESTREHASERKNQYELCVKFIENQQVDFTVFGGDLNAREIDVPKSISSFDCWTLAGRPSDHQYTWDLVRNKNAFFPDGSQPRCRFDRMYLIPGRETGKRVLSKFELVGTKPIPNLGHASDHFGIFIEISLQ